MQIEYKPVGIDEMGLSERAPEFEEFSRIFERFQPVEEPAPPEEQDPQLQPPGPADVPQIHIASDEEEEELDEEQQRYLNASRKKLLKLQRMSVAELKTRAAHPEVVDWVDVTAEDPDLLVHLKGYRNLVPVPGHWSMKRKYLAGKRGIVRPPFELPEYIKDTGISQMRETVRETESEQSLKSKQRQRTQPKMGKIVVDYQRLHDAFFKYQTKPIMTPHGDLYREGKEFETKLREKKPGVLSQELREALGMTHPLLPPPWLLNMQRFGPPPSYPKMRIPGLNAPIPEGAQWGYHPGGWGKPPVDQYNRPLYGDVFGLYSQYQTQLHSNMEAANLTATVEREFWGEIKYVHVESEPEPEEEEEPSDREESDQDQGEDQPAKVTPISEFNTMQGLVTPSGIMTTSGLATPRMIELRKTKPTSVPPTSTREPVDQKDQKQLYTVLEQKEVRAGEGFMASQHVYDLGGRGGSEQPVAVRKRKFGNKSR